MSVFTVEFEKNSRVIAQNNTAFALLTYTPITPGHTLVCPKREVASVDELTSEELIDIHALARAITQRMKIVLGAEGFNFAWNQGERAGQSVPHFHLHIVPRTLGDTGIYDYEPRTFLYRPGSRARVPKDELSALADLLKLS